NLNPIQPLQAAANSRGNFVVWLHSFSASAASGILRPILGPQERSLGVISFKIIIELETNSVSYYYRMKYAFPSSSSISIKA
ncbi:MAG: hypothetical protein Q9M23_00265, partial [Mariprofundaceae bacterium]|nr:hypothetical protein [Mariprofundaceae bacterium]